MDFRTVSSLLLLLLSVCTAQQHEDLRSDNDELSLEDLEMEDMTTTILRTNKDSKLFLLEGDIEIPTSRNSIKCLSKQKSCLWPKSGSQVIIPYTISSIYNEERTKAIEAAMAEIKSKTCVTFVPRKDERAYLAIESKNGCSSLVGRANQRQRVSLRIPGCLKHGIILHELLHALGFYHEHTRNDRDQYVKINWDNMHRFHSYNFKKRDSDYLRTPYDYGSVMHYGRRAFGQDRKETIIPLKDDAVIGQREHLSSIDALRINRLYKC